ncbi:MAG TPA: hypothetical protein VIZ62_11090 [Nitrososphaeraceae archaeon]
MNELMYPIKSSDLTHEAITQQVFTPLLKVNRIIPSTHQHPF